MQKQISPCIVLRKHEWAHMNEVLPAKIREGNCTKRYLRGLKNQNREHQTSSKVIPK